MGDSFDVEGFFGVFYADEVPHPTPGASGATPSPLLA